MLDKKTYEYFQSRLKEGLQEKEVRQLSDEWLKRSVKSYLQGNYKQMQEDLDKGNRFQRMLKKAVKDPVSYVVGIFSGTVYAMELLTGFSRQRMGVFGETAVLFKKANVGDIAEYLYKNPNAQHKTISAELGLNKGYLSQLLREMERTGCVERYAAGRMSFYSLTLYGQEFVKREKLRKSLTNPVRVMSTRTELLEEKYSAFVVSPLERRQKRQKYEPEIKSIYLMKNASQISGEWGEMIAKC